LSVTLSTPELKDAFFDIKPSQAINTVGYFMAKTSSPAAIRFHGEDIDSIIYSGENYFVYYAMKGFIGEGNYPVGGFLAYENFDRQLYVHDDIGASFGLLYYNREVPLCLMEEYGLRETDGQAYNRQESITVNNLIANGVTLHMIQGELNYRDVLPSSNILRLYESLHALGFEELQTIYEYYRERFTRFSRPHSMTGIIGESGVEHFLSFADGRRDGLIGNLELIAYNDDGTFTFRVWGGDKYAVHSMAPSDLAEYYNFDSELKKRFLDVYYNKEETRTKTPIDSYSYGSSAQERDVIMASDDVNSVSNLIQGGDEKSAKDVLTEQLVDGVRRVLDSENFKNYLKTSSRLYFCNYSLNNTILVWLQKPDASHVMGYEQWKDFGRNVNQGASGARILIPVMAREKTQGSLAASIRRNLYELLDKNPASAIVVYKFGMTKLEFTMNRSNHLIGIKVDGKETGLFKSDTQFKQYIDRAILGKVPMYFAVGNVFDEKDVIIPEFLWVKRGYKPDEVVNDEKGCPIKNKRGEVKIINTPERQARFVPSVGLELSAKDPIKMGRLFAAASAVCQNRGVAVLLRNKDNDDHIKSGSEGYYQKAPIPDTPYDEAMAQLYPNGLIVIDSEQDITKQCAVMFHEMAHSELHQEIYKLAVELGENVITKSMREVQAQAVSYAVSNQFGIDNDDFTFDYIGAYTKGFEFQEMQKSLEVIHKEIRNLFNDIKAELDKTGFNLDLTEKPRDLLEADTVKIFTVNALNYSLEQEKIVASVKNELPGLIAQFNDSVVLDVLKEYNDNVNIRQENIDLAKAAVEALNSAVTREDQDIAIENINASTTRIAQYATAFEDLTERFIDASEHSRNSIKLLYDKDPAEALLKLSENYPRLAELSNAQMDYLSTSKYVDQKLSRLLRSDVPGFVEKACDRASYVSAVSSKNGTFCEINFCEAWFDKPIFENGALCHPKIADIIIKQAEIQIRGMKTEFERSGEYVPYSKCDITIYSPVDGNGLTAFNTRVDIGDGEQDSLKGHISAMVGSNKLIDNVYEQFVVSLKERDYKDKIITPTTLQNQQANEVKSIGANRDTRKKTSREWNNEINESRAAEGKAQNNIKQQHKDNEANKKMTSRKNERIL